MKAALTVWNGRVSPVFDVSREAVVLTIEDGSVAALSRESIDTPNGSLKVDRILNLGIDVLVCGAISESLHRELCARSVTVHGFVAGEIEQVIGTVMNGQRRRGALRGRDSACGAVCIHVSGQSTNGRERDDS